MTSRMTVGASPHACLLGAMYPQVADTEKVLGGKE
jgi:hypothetical protein